MLLVAAAYICSDADKDSGRQLQRLADTRRGRVGKGSFRRCRSSYAVILAGAPSYELSLVGLGPIDDT